MIGPLTDPVAHGGDAADAFDVVCPSLPGYGFSDKPTEEGYGVEKIADTWAALMARLGYDRYVAQGGDWGSMVTNQIGLRDTEHCAAIHLNMPVVLPDPETMNDLTPLEQSALMAAQHYEQKDSGYSKQQSTRPRKPPAPLHYFGLLQGLPPPLVDRHCFAISKPCGWVPCALL